MPAQNLPGLVLDRSHRLAGGLLNWWPMNEQAGPGLVDVVTGRPIVAVNMSARWRTGSPVGGAVLFDGTDDYVPFTVSVAVSGWSMSFWVCPNAWQGSSPYERTLMGGYAGPPYIRMMFGGDGLAGNKQRLSVDNGYATLITTVDQALDKWIHVVGTCDAVSQKCYVNGALIGSGASSGPMTSAGTLHIGALNGYGRYFSGGMAHVRLYSRVLDAREVAQLYADPLAGALIRRRLYVPAAPATAKWQDASLAGFPNRTANTGQLSGWPKVTTPIGSMSAWPKRKAL